MSNMSVVQEGLDLSESFLEAFRRCDQTSENLFITGKAGTGKSTFLKYFRENTSKKIAVLAPTGVAAVNVQGQTIHSFFYFKPDITVDGVFSIKMHKQRRKMYQKIDAIIIDEISMVRADLLDCIDAFLRVNGPKPNTPFGGVQMIFFGDLFQLPPVVNRMDAEIFRTAYLSPYFFDSNSFKSLDMKTIELDKVYRQDDDQFLDILNAIRHDKMEARHLNLLSKRFKPSFKPQEDELYIYLTTTNAIADQVNQRQLQSLRTKPYAFDGYVVGSFDQKSLPTQEQLALKFGAQVMLLNNDPHGRWINGSIGKIVAVLETQDVIMIELDTGETVEVEPFTWEMYRYEYDEETKTVESESIGSFTQYPIKLAWAVTIHKSQGKTFTNAIIDLGRGTFAHGQLYVALSRCTSLEGIVLKTPISAKHIILDQRVVDFMNPEVKI